MRLPTISDYVSTLANPEGVFRTLGGGEDAGGSGCAVPIEVDRDIYREIELRAGNSAAVFTYTFDGKTAGKTDSKTEGNIDCKIGEGARSVGRRRFLKCYIRPNPYLRPIYRYVEKHRPPLLADVRLLRDELYVHPLAGGDRWVDVVEGEWTEGETLDAVSARMAGGEDGKGLLRLARTFDVLCRELLVQEWAHGDLKPENIVVGKGGVMTLVDCDAMWLPEFAGLPAAELGTPAYRHPARSAAHFDKRIDDYPAMLVSASLHALALDPSLFARYNTSDNIIFSPAELVEGRSAAFGDVAELFARRGRARELRMLEACCTEYIASGTRSGDFSATADDAGRFFEMTACRCDDRDGGSAGGFSDGFADGCDDKPDGRLVVAERAGKWGYADADGRFRIAPFWDEALEFRQRDEFPAEIIAEIIAETLAETGNDPDEHLPADVAAVRLGRWWHLIDRRGNLLATGLSQEEIRTVRKIPLKCCF